MFFRPAGQILENEPDVSKTCHKEEEKQLTEVYSTAKQKRPKKKSKKPEKLFLSPKVLKRLNMNEASTKTSVDRTEDVTKVEYESLTSTGGVKDQTTLESELMTARGFTRDNIFHYELKHLVSYSPKHEAEAQTRRKMKQVGTLHQSLITDQTPFQTREHAALCMVVLTFLLCHSMRFLAKLYEIFIIDDYLNEQR